IRGSLGCSTLVEDAAGYFSRGLPQLLEQHVVEDVHSGVAFWCHTRADDGLASLADEEIAAPRAILEIRIATAFHEDRAARAVPAHMVASPPHAPKVRHALEFALGVVFPLFLARFHLPNLLLGQHGLARVLENRQHYRFHRLREIRSRHL